MIENLRLARKFYAMMTILLFTPAYIIIHLAFLVNIPYVPTMLVFRFPAVLIATLIYIQFMVAMWNMRLKMLFTAPEPEMAAR